MDSLSVLVIEDSPSFSRLLVRGLEKEGYHVDLAPDISSAQDYLNQREYTLWLVDKKLPDGDGVELIFVLRQRGDDTPCIAMCEPDFSESQSPELEKDINEFLPKPFAFDDLVKRMENLVRNAASEKFGKPQAKAKLKRPAQKPQAEPQFQASINEATSRGALDPPSNLFRVISAEEGLAKLSESTRLQQEAEKISKSLERRPQTLRIMKSVLTPPTEEEIMSVFGELLDVSLSCQRGIKLAPSKQTPMIVASFISPTDQKLLALCFMDLPLAHSAAGALSLATEEEVKAQMEMGDLPEHLFALLKEVFRVLGGVFQGPQVKEVHLHHTYRAKGLLPHEDAEIIENHVHRLDLKFKLEGYPGGNFSLLLD